MDEDTYDGLRLEPDDDDWDDRIEAMLSGGSYDADLGKRMAADAIRVSLGELSDREFHEKYHDEVTAEFGIDDRPIESEAHDNE